MASAEKAIFMTGSALSPKSDVDDIRLLIGGLLKQSKERAMKAKSTADLCKVDSALCRLLVSIRDSAISGVLVKSKVDRLIEFMHEKRMLIRCYTQIVNSVHALYTGQSKSDDRLAVVPLNGSLHRLCCLSCKSTEDWSEAYRELMLVKGMFPKCSVCSSHADTNYGVLIPDIETFTNQKNFAELISHDLEQRPDIFVIVGTTLNSSSMNGLVRQICQEINSYGGTIVYVNSSPPSSQVYEMIDYAVVAENDAWVDDLSELFPEKFPPEKILG
ncbi:hypothetical protein V1512DRAFT_246461 [Lipomyces arxii]|uniref:uncharacterized protein n=1 Tax=Lipomyces arxii TaxID=56418 RepID=UPI0034CF37A4